MSDLMNKIVSLSKRRGFVFQSSEIYGGLKSCYDFGPLGVELKKNIASEWWRHMVYERDNIYGLDASILMHTDVWKASGHLANFSDPLVDCLNCKERFRADKAPKVEKGSEASFKDGGKAKGALKKAVCERSYVCPNCGSPLLSDERQFRLMFQTTMGPVDPVSEYIEKNYDKSLSKDDFQKGLNEVLLGNSSVYLRPETAQAMFVQFLNVQQSMSAKVPFGIAQAGKSFRNEVVTEHFIFRSCEFEQLEMEFFCEPGTQKEWMEHWKNERLKWHKSLVNNPENFRLRAHDDDELAHYAEQCFDVEYNFPWGWDELEGVASRTDYDLKKHAEASGVKLSYFDPQKKAPGSDKQGWRYIPYVIEPALGLTRNFLAILADAYTEETKTDANGKTQTRTLLKLHPKLAPFKAAILPLVKKHGMPEMAKKVVDQFRKSGIPISYDENHSIGKRYARHDEIGTPFCLTIDGDSLTDQQVTIRYRDTTEQKRLKVEEAFDIVKQEINKN